MKLKTNLENWILQDHNPFIIFSNEGKVIYLNDAGEYLLSFISPKEVYEKIIKYAPKEKGFEHIREKFEFNNFSYDYALIGYDTFDEIGVRFYQNIKPIKKVEMKLDKFNIYFILDLVRTYVFMDKDIKFIDTFDVDLPEIKCNKDKLIKILTSMHEMVKNNEKLYSEVKLKIGEYVKVFDKKYKILEISIMAENIEKKEVNSEFMDVIIQDNKVSLLMPFIT